MDLDLRVKYPSFHEVEKLIEDDFNLSSEHSVYNHKRMEQIFNNYYDRETVKRMGEQINEQGRLQSLQANFYILCQVFKHLLHVNPERDPDLRVKLIMIRDFVKSSWDGVGDWGN